jgi:uncharacterized membrane protein YhaH (DUF805 family)
VKKTTAADRADHDHEYMVPGMVPDGARTKSAQWRVEQKWDRLHGLCQIDFAQAGPTLRTVHAAAWFLLERCAMSTQNPYESPRDLEPGYSPRQAPEDRNLAWLLFSFHGRIPRSVYWAAVIVAWLALIAVAVIASVLFPALDADTGAVVGLLFIPPYVAYVWVNLALQAKRWHDRDKSAWWILMGMVPVLGPIVVFVEVGCLRGTPGRNRYGDDPTPGSPELCVSELRRGSAVLGEVVEMDGTDVTDEDLACLAGNAEIKELRLGGSGITDAGLEHIRGLTGLEILDLSLTGISDKGIDCLRGLLSLTTLYLGGSKVSDAGLLRLDVLDCLEDVYAVNTDITAEGAKWFAGLRPHCTVHL